MRADKIRRFTNHLVLFFGQQTAGDGSAARFSFNHSTKPRNANPIKNSNWFGCLDEKNAS